MTNPPCRIDQRPAIDKTAVICAHCLEELEKALGDVAALTTPRPHETYDGGLVADLRATYAGQHAITASGRTVDDDHRDRNDNETDDDYRDRLCQQSGETRQERIGRLVDELANELATTVRMLELDTAGRTPRALATALLIEHDRLAHHPAADEIHDGIVGVVERCRHAIDRPADLRYLGRCYIDDTCDAGLWARPGVSRVQCQTCGATYDADALRTHLLEEVRDRTGTATEIARALTSLKQPVTPERIRTWAARGRIAQRGVEPSPRAWPVYRIGDVMNLLDREEVSRQNRAS